MADDPSPVDADEAARRRQQRAQWNRGFAEHVPHNRALGLSIVDLGDDWSLYRLAWDEKLVGNPETGVLHGGAITTLLDAACGSAVFAALPAPVPCATLDLRIDYLRPSERGLDVLARATCFKVTRNVAFVRAIAFEENAENPIAHAVSAFMVNANAGRKVGANYRSKKT
jgi:uncharacterized protein (TIGR00369 family)